MTLTFNDDTQCQCDCCLEIVPITEIKTRRLNTMYVNDESNFLTSCLYCYEDCCAGYQELWDSYYADLRESLH